MQANYWPTIRLQHGFLRLTVDALQYSLSRRFFGCYYLTALRRKSRHVFKHGDAYLNLDDDYHSKTSQGPNP